MKKIFITFCVLVLSCAAFGQQIKSKNAELEDLITLLNFAGYELFSFDISEMLNEQYDITIVQKEFLAGKEIESSDIDTISNMMLLTDFPESSRQEVLQDILEIGLDFDHKTQVFAKVEKINFGFIPSGNDSTKFILIDVPVRNKNRVTLKLRGLTTNDSNKMLFYYHTRLFKISIFKEDEFIPLILFGSAWYDERFNIFRFCGEREIDPDMSSEILKDIPHHYVVGVKFVKRQ